MSIDALGPLSRTMVALLLDRLISTDLELDLDAAIGLMTLRGGQPVTARNLIRTLAAEGVIIDRRDHRGRLIAVKAHPSLTDPTWGTTTLDRLSPEQ